MNHLNYRLLGSLLAILIATLLFLQISVSFFTPQHTLTFARPEPPRQVSVTPTPLTVINGGAGGAYNVLATKCESGITSPPAGVFTILAPGWTINDLAENYQHETQPILCYDGFKSEWAVPGGTWLKTSDFLTTMSWPADLFNPSVEQILVAQHPHAVLKPSHDQTNPQQTSQQQNDTCNWTVDLLFAQPTINICDLISTVLNAAILTPLKSGVNQLAGGTNSFLLTTPPHLSYGNPDLALFWNVSLYIVNALLVVVLAWAAIRYMMGKSFGSWLSYADLLEMLPRLILALIAAYISARICQIVIDGSNALSSIFNADLISSLKNDPKDLFTIFVQILLALLVLILILEEAIRFALLFVLIGFAPIWAFCGALRETQFIFKGALKALFLVSLLQPCQLAVMSLGQHMTANLGGNADSLLYSFVSLALMLLVIFMMGWFLRAAGMSMPFGLVGATGLAIGARMAGRGISQTVRGQATTIKNSPRLASTVIHAPGRAYRAARGVPSNLRTGISTAQAKMSQAYRTLTTAGTWLANPPGTRSKARPKP